MKRLFAVIRNNKIWTALSAVLVAVGAGAYVPAVNLGTEASQATVEAYCEANKDAEECEDLQEE